MINYFGSSIFLWLLLLVPVFIYWQSKKQKRPTVYYSDLELIKAALPHDLSWLRYLLVILQALILVVLIIALARPQIQTARQEIYNNGIDMVLALDASGSMGAEDLVGNRLASAKKISSEFVLKRKQDRFSLVVFGRTTVTRAPLTADRQMIVNLLDKVKLGEVGDGTAIGEAIATALNRLRSSEAKSKIMILVTDGDNNAGRIGPLDAARLAAKMGVKIYTIGIGSPEGAPLVVYDPQYGKQYVRNPDGTMALTKMNVADLIKIANITDGKFYRAENTNQLEAVFQSIDALEKTKIKSDTNYLYQEKFQTFLWLALILLVVLIIIEKYFQLRSITKINSALYNVSNSRARLRSWLLLAGIFFLFIALLRPQWGVNKQNVERRGLDIVFTLDISNSMLSRDVQPSRLDRSLQEIGVLLGTLPGDRVGLVTFAGSATPVCPLTLDYNALEMFLRSIKYYKEPTPGTDIYKAFQVAQGLFEPNSIQDKIVIIFTDGEDLQGNVLKIKSEAEKNKIIVIPIAVGTASGQPIPEYNDDGQQVGLKKDKKGQVVISHLDLKTLQKIADVGPYQLNSSVAGRIVQDLAGLHRSKLKEKHISLRSERFQWFLFPSFMLIVFYLLFSIYEDKLKR